MKACLLVGMLLIATIAKNSPTEQDEELSKRIDLYNEEQEKIKEQKYREAIVAAIISVESNNDIAAYNSGEDAVSLLQIRKCVVDDLNRIYGSKRYTYKDRWSREKAIQMFWEYQEHWNKDIHLESCSRIWNGGPRGESKSSTDRYYIKVLEKFLVS
jgi:hypothetical protein